MSVVKVIEVMASSSKSWEDAAQTAVNKACQTLQNVRSIYIQDHCAVVENGAITEYRITGKISFQLQDNGE